MDHHGVDEDPKKRFKIVISLPFRTKRTWPLLSIPPGRLLSSEMPILATEELKSHENNRPLELGRQPSGHEIKFNIPIGALFLAVPSGGPQYLLKVYQVPYR